MSTFPLDFTEFRSLLQLRLGSDRPREHRGAGGHHEAHAKVRRARCRYYRYWQLLSVTNRY